MQFDIDCKQLKVQESGICYDSANCMDGDPFHGIRSLSWEH